DLRVPIVVGIEADCLDAALQQTAQAKKHGASAVLVRYLGSRPEEALGFFYCLSEKNLLPILYDHDRGTLPARTVGHILRVPNVIGMREANLDLVEARAHLKVCASTGKSCFAGSTRDLGRFLCAGGHGVMCPEATLLPGQTRFVYRASRHGHGREACAVCEELEQVSAAVNATAPAGNGVVLALHRLVPASEPTSDVEAPAALKYGLTCVGVEMPEYTRCPAPVMIVEQSRRTVLARLRNRSQVAPVPYSQGNGQQNWGALLRTGGFQLAPGVSHDLLRSQGDGLWGFPIGN
ncbi:MAG: dihydrodipicolinate synthase family protein, partial [Gemmataceae bacterium]